MKKNIVICCETMDEARLKQWLKVSLAGLPPKLILRGEECTAEFGFCPWCGKALPFSFESVNRFDDSVEETP